MSTKRLRTDQPPTTNHQPPNYHISLFSTLRTYLQLARPANVVTAWADVLAGSAAAGAVALVQPVYGEAGSLPWLLLATTGLYSGGVILNDVFDAKLDATERPERPIPSGRIPRHRAALFGTLMLLIGIWGGFRSSLEAGLIAVSIALLATVYDAWAKHHILAGPLAMGLCRAGNLLLGVAYIPALLPSLWYLGAIPIVYIGAITLISQQEVEGGNRTTAWLALALVAITFAGLPFLATNTPFWQWLPFWLGWGLFVGRAFFQAAQHPTPQRVMKAVKTGVIGLIPLNAALAALFVGWIAGLIVLVLLPISIGLARLFAVT